MIDEESWEYQVVKLPIRFWIVFTFGYFYGFYHLTYVYFFLPKKSFDISK